MGQYKWLNRERVLFLFFFCVCAWEIRTFIFARPVAPEIKKAVIADSDVAGELRKVPEIGAFGTYLASGRDVFVPVVLSTTYDEYLKIQVSPSRPPRYTRTTVAGSSVSLPVKPAKKKPPKPGGKDAYRLPLEVKGWILAEGQVRKILVNKTGTEQYFTLNKGDEYKGVRVIEITSDSVIFENELGRRFLLNRTMLDAAKQVNSRKKSLTEFGKGNSGLAEGEKEKGGIDPLFANKTLRDFMQKNKISKDKLQKLSKQYGKNITLEILNSLSGKQAADILQLLKTFAGNH